MRRINFKKIFSVAFLLCLTIITNAQGEKQTDFMRSNGRIYVVIAVILTILTGVILFLVRLERKLKKLEEES